MKSFQLRNDFVIHLERIATKWFSRRDKSGAVTTLEREIGLFSIGWRRNLASTPTPA